MRRHSIASKVTRHMAERPFEPGPLRDPRLPCFPLSCPPRRLCVTPRVTFCAMQSSRGPHGLTVGGARSRRSHQCKFRFQEARSEFESNTAANLIPRGECQGPGKIGPGAACEIRSNPAENNLKANNGTGSSSSRAPSLCLSADRLLLNRGLRLSHQEALSSSPAPHIWFTHTEHTFKCHPGRTGLRFDAALSS